MFYFMKRNLLFLMLGLSSFLFFSCSSNDDEWGGNGKDKYYIKYSMKGSASYRGPFAHSNQVRSESSTIEFQDKNGLSVEGEYGTFTFTKVVGPVGKSFKQSLSASGRDGGAYSAQYQGSIEVLKNGKALVGSASGSGSGRVYITCPINE